MSWKAVELQVALPRTHEVSRIHDQQLQRNMHEQLGQIQERKQVDEAARTRAQDVDESASALIREHPEGRQRQQKKPRPGKKDQSAPKPEPPAAKDPLRGNHIDISL